MGSHRVGLDWSDLAAAAAALCIIGSRFIQLIRSDSNMFLFKAEQYSSVYMYYNFLIHSSASGHPDCLHVLLALTKWSWLWLLWSSHTENSSTSHLRPWVIAGKRDAPHPTHLEELSSVTWVRNVFMLCFNNYSFVDYWLLLPKITLTNLEGKERFQNDNSETVFEHLEDVYAQEKYERICCQIQLNILRRDLQFRWRLRG